MPRVWGVREAEMPLELPCDDVFDGQVDTWYRGVTVRADPAVVFRWLCQLKVAPYSYDLVNNLGRRSPRTLTPGAGELEVGQRVMDIFRLEHFTPDRDLTIKLDHRWSALAFGAVAVTYTVRPAGPGESRLLEKIVTPGSGRRLAGLRRELLAWGDLIMTRKQMRVLGGLAERDSSHGEPDTSDSAPGSASAANSSASPSA